MYYSDHIINMQADSEKTELGETYVWFITSLTVSYHVLSASGSRSCRPELRRASIIYVTPQSRTDFFWRRTHLSLFSKLQPALIVGVIHGPRGKFRIFVICYGAGFVLKAVSQALAYESNKHNSLHKPLRVVRVHKGISYTWTHKHMQLDIIMYVCMYILCYVMCIRKLCLPIYC